MSSKGNKAVIGAFVLGAIGLLVAGVLVFGSVKFFSPQKKYVMYFDGSVKGLSVGAPVVFRGVKIGSVIDILLQGDLREMTFRVPVIAEINMSRFSMTNAVSGSVDYHQALIDRGLRAQLQTQSLVTGQLMVDFDFHPDRPVRILTDTTGYPQIPTIPSTADELAQKLEELPLQQLVERANSLMGGLEKLVNSPDMQNAPLALNLAVADARALLEKVGREVELLSADARGTIGAATATINHANQMLNFEDGVPAEVVNNLNQTLADARTAFRRMDETLGSIQSVVTDERSTYQLRHALNDLGEASRSLSSLADYLEQHPEALLRGKTNLEEK
jgi:paraquat-inducible protein B